MRLWLSSKRDIKSRTIECDEIFIPGEFLLQNFIREIDILDETLIVISVINAHKGNIPPVSRHKAIGFDVKADSFFFENIKKPPMLSSFNY